MPPRIAYWTSAFELDMEAVASEVATLRREFPWSVVWGLSYGHWARLSQRRGYCLNPRLHLLFRTLTRILEPAFDLNHVFGSLGDWFYLQGTRKRPTILTMAAINPPVHGSLLERIDRFVVEYPEAKEDLRGFGIKENRIRLIFPPVDLRRFSPGKVPDGPFTVLFASSPEEESWLDARGIPQILDTAVLRPRMRFRLLWRPWGNSAERVRQWITHRGLQNVELVVKSFSDMASEYNKAHVTLAPFTDIHRSKPAPNSLIESMACGRPVLATAVVGLANLIREGTAGVVCNPTGAEIAQQLDCLSKDWGNYSRCARKLAEAHFGMERFLQDYKQLYDEVLHR
ncbi:MAG: glycosyltransferase [Deltaproteobacteria bacterium]|nr:glycosyltransferase [Deltaproteobacteria bacterium]